MPHPAMPTLPSGDTELRDSTRQELYERARRLGVEGRSRMTKQELALALAEARSVRPVAGTGR